MLKLKHTDSPFYETDALPTGLTRHLPFSFKKKLCSNHFSYLLVPVFWYSLTTLPPHFILMALFLCSSFAAFVMLQLPSQILKKKRIQNLFLSSFSFVSLLALTLLTILFFRKSFPFCPKRALEVSGFSPAFLIFNPLFLVSPFSKAQPLPFSQPLSWLDPLVNWLCKVICRHLGISATCAFSQFFSRQF